MALYPPSGYPVVPAHAEKAISSPRGPKKSAGPPGPAMPPPLTIIGLFGLSAHGPSGDAQVA